MTAVEFMKNSFHLLIGVICWGGIILVLIVILAILFRLTINDKKEDTEDGD